MKILLISRPFVFYGGVETATDGFVRALVRHGHDVHLLSPPGQEPVPGVALHTLPLPPLPRSGRALALAIGARLAIAGHHWDIVQSHERTLRQDVYRAGEGCHRAYLASRDGDPSRGLYHRVVLALERRALMGASEVVAIAKAGKAEIERLYAIAPERVTVVYNGVDLDRFHPRNRALHRSAARSEAGVPGDAWVVLFLGSGFARKGLNTAIEGFAALRDPRSRLIVVGRDDAAPYRALAEKLGIGARVVWLGARADPERWYAAADVVVLPSRYEPFGNVHLEALASGVPVVTSTRAGGAEILAPGRNGAVVDPHDPAAVATSLEQFRSTSAADLVEAARRGAEPFTYEAQVAGFGMIYRRVSARKA